MKKNILVKFFVFMFAVCTCFLFSGCEFTFNSNKEVVEISGKVLIDGNGLEGVSIKSKYREYCKTNSSGDFSFTANKSSIEIFAEKEGYSFTEILTLENNIDNAVFNAKEVTNLNGELILKRIVITPIAIISLYNENYEYNNYGAKCIKVGMLEVNINSNNILKNTGVNYLEKHKDNVIPLTQEIKYLVDQNTELSINFKLNAYVTYNQQEELINDNYIKIVKSNLKTDLLHDGKVEFNLFGINSKTGGYTYNISFQFEYNEITNP